MHAVILAAGEGSRMGPHTADVPKAFMTLAGRTLYERQRAAIDDHVDGVTAVLGYAAENVREAVADARTVVFEEWAEYENAESLRRGIAGLEDDVLVFNGDVIVTEAAVTRLVERFERAPTRSVVGCLPGTQTGETAVRSDDRGVVTDYGMIPGHRHAGLGLVAEDHLPTARSYLADHRREWYPGLYTVVETEIVRIPTDHHIEINRPRDKVAARNKLPLDAADGVDLQT